MSYKQDIYESEVVERDGMTFRVDWIADYDSSPDWMGEYFGTHNKHGKKSGEHYVDRKTGILYSGETIAEEREFKIASDNALDAYEWDCENGMCALLVERDDDRAWLSECERLGDEDGIAENVYGDDPDEPIGVIVHRYIYEVLADNLSSNYGRNDFEYWGRSQHLPYKASNWAGAHDEQHTGIPSAENLKKFKEHGIHQTDNLDKDLSTLYACEDYERMEDLQEGNWCFVGCVATLITDSEDFESSGLWGIESDCGDDYKKEVADEQIDDVISQLPKEITERCGVLDKLAKILDARNALK